MDLAAWLASVPSWKSANKSKACDGIPSTPGYTQPCGSGTRPAGGEPIVASLCNGSDAVERNPQSIDPRIFHGATRPQRAAAPEQGWVVLDGARRPQGCCYRPPN